ncbi:MAG TPA: hypothetical protein VIY07_18945, partial [Pseudolabrys sp.]
GSARLFPSAAAGAITVSLDKLGSAVGLFAHTQVRWPEATGLGFTRGPAPVARLSATHGAKL